MCFRQHYGTMHETNLQIVAKLAATEGASCFLRDHIASRGCETFMAFGLKMVHMCLFTSIYIYIELVIYIYHHHIHHISIYTYNHIYNHIYTTILLYNYIYNYVYIYI